MLVFSSFLALHALPRAEKQAARPFDQKNDMGPEASEAQNPNFEGGGRPKPRVRRAAGTTVDLACISSGAKHHGQERYKTRASLF